MLQQIGEYAMFFHTPIGEHIPNMILWILYMLIGASISEAGHGVSRIGTLKYAADFSHYDYVNPHAPKGGTLNVGVVGTFSSLNPYMGGICAAHTNLTRATLMTRSADEPLSSYGYVANNVIVAKDNAWMQLHINPEARFLDGKAITADDIIASWHYWKNAGIPSMRVYKDNICSIQKLSSHAVKFFFNKGINGLYMPALPHIVGMMPLLSVDRIRAGGVSSSSPLPSTGPYYIKEFDMGRRIVYERVHGWWGDLLSVAKGRFNFDTIVVHYFRNERALFEAFKRGQVDVFMETDIGRWEKPNMYESAGRKHTIKRIRVPHNRPMGIQGLFFNIRRFPFDNIKVRKALVYMFDAHWVNTKLYNGDCTVIESFFADTGLYNGLDMSDKPYSGLSAEYMSLRKRLKLARALFKEAGWEYRKGSLYHRDTGKYLSFTILISHTRMSLAVKHFVRMARLLGAHVVVRAVGDTQFMYEKRRLHFDMVCEEWPGTRLPGHELINFIGSSSAYSQNTLNYPGIEKSSIDTLINKLTYAHTEEQINKYTQRLDKALCCNHYVIPLVRSVDDKIAYWSYVGMPILDGVVSPRLESWWFKGN